ncbi:MAG: hypothetical protein A3G41_02505 [Elusimicrobia bacterium RIFCSPLOWO2_12_FULL_59_9]|nr:MAG: hypothetical protein A3G41_02505 [Elusimicrobia bacterium RIFCSPLOWO2_12_FULL_59_9]
MIILAVATSWESAPLARALGLRQAPKGRFEGAVSGRRVWMIQTGMGGEKTRLALDALPADVLPELVVSAGFAGALRSGLRTGEVVLDAGAEGADLENWRRRLGERGLSERFGRVASAGRILRTPGEKEIFAAESGALAVDMEWDALKAWAQERGIAAVAVKAVVDELDHALPVEVPEACDALAAARFILARPARIPAAVATYFRCRKATRELKAFLEKFLPAACEPANLADLPC